jgi:hypothetical protein
MQITRVSQISGNTNTLEIAVTQEQLNNYYREGMLLQDAFPNISAAEREFIKSGITDEEWQRIFGEVDENEIEEELETNL